VKPIFPSSPILALFFIVFSCSLLPATLVSAESVDASQWEITADKITRFEDPPSIIAEGNVILEKKEPVTRIKKAPRSRWSGLLKEGKTAQSDAQEEESVTENKTVTTVKADWVAYDVNLGTVKARGNLTIAIGTDRLKAESGTIDLQKATGTFDNATIVRQEKDLHFEGKVIEKTGELTYHIEDGWVVTCKLQEGETPPWSFAAADAEITDGGYALLKHATFRIKDVPVLYTPIMLLPAKRQRQTGFLFPSVSMSDRDGFSLETPFFINLSPSTDLTLFPRYYANRGMMMGAEYRYILDENSKGMLMGNYLDDALSDPSEVSYYEEGDFTHTNSSRYWVRGKADQNINEWISRVDLDVVSDLDYLEEFNTGSTGFSSSEALFSDVFGRGFDDNSDPYRDNTVAFLRSWNNGTALLGEFLVVDDVSEEVYTADDPSQVWKLPSVNYAGLLPVKQLGTTDFSWDATYINFYREEGVGAQRLDLVPLLTTAIPLAPYLETTVNGGIRETSYIIQDNGASDWEDTSSENRFLYTMGGQIGTTLMRDFSVNMENVNSLGHTLRPYVSYTYTSIPDEVNLPQFDTIDELDDENIFYYGVNNFLTLSGDRKGREYDRDYAFLKAKQGYDMRSTESDTPLTPVEIETGFYPWERTRLKYTTELDVYGDGAYLHSIEADYSSDAGDRFSTDYRYNSLTDVNSISGSIWYLLPYNFAAGYSLVRSIEADETIQEKIRLLYRAPCWSVELLSYSTTGDQTYMVTFRLANIGNPLGIDVPGM
jgi:LPS-assembly protein